MPHADRYMLAAGHARGSGPVRTQTRHSIDLPRLTRLDVFAARIEAGEQEEAGLDVGRERGADDARCARIALTDVHPAETGPEHRRLVLRYCRDHLDRCIETASGPVQEAEICAEHARLSLIDSDPDDCGRWLDALRQLAEQVDDDGERSRLHQLATRRRRQMESLREQRQEVQ